jgi:hypothetical protein
MMSECPFDYIFAYLSFGVGMVCIGCVMIIAFSRALLSGQRGSNAEYGRRSAVRGVLIVWAIAAGIEVPWVLSLFVGQLAEWFDTHGIVRVLTWPVSTIVALSSVFFLRSVAGRVKVIGWFGLGALALLGIVGGGAVYGLVVNHCGSFLKF